jgi:hypothetical protein
MPVLAACHPGRPVASNISTRASASRPGSEAMDKVLIELECMAVQCQAQPSKVVTL